MTGRNQSYRQTGPELIYEVAMNLYVISSAGKIYTVRECPGTEFRAIISRAVSFRPDLKNDMERLQWDHPIDRWWILCRMVELKLPLPCTDDCSTLLARYADARRNKTAV